MPGSAIGSPSFLPSLRVSIHALSRVHHLSEQCGATLEHFGRPPRTVCILTLFAIMSMYFYHIPVRRFQRRFNKEAFIAALPYDSRELAEQLLSTQVCYRDRIANARCNEVDAHLKPLQAFANFIDDRIQPDAKWEELPWPLVQCTSTCLPLSCSTDVDVAFFDESIDAKYNRSTFVFSKRETPLLNSRE